MKKIYLMIMLGIFSINIPIVLAASAWPVATSTTISSALTSTLPPSGRIFEPSDIAITDTGVVLVSDEGDVAVMNDDGSSLTEWLVEANADLEGISVDGDNLYVLHERERDVYAYNASSHVRIATYDLSP